MHNIIVVSAITTPPMTRGHLYLMDHSLYSVSTTRVFIARFHNSGWWWIHNIEQYNIWTTNMVKNNMKIRYLALRGVGYVYRNS